MLRAELEETVSGNTSLEVAGVRLVCKHCGHNEFIHRTTQMNTAVATFFALDWLNPAADVYVCTRCGFLHHFLSPRVDEDVRCMSCGETLPAGSERCHACGWSYVSDADG